MRFEARAAITIGILLPVLEAYRRGLTYWNVEFTTMVEDNLAGAIPFTAAWGAPEPDSALVIGVKVALFTVSALTLVSTLRSRMRDA